jgi:FlaA1/EpsC-like NDP-sugar epimerase
MINTILVTGSTGTIGSEEIVVRRLGKKEDVNFLTSGAISKVMLIFEEETTESKPITLRKFADNYADEELR